MLPVHCVALSTRKPRLTGVRRDTHNHVLDFDIEGRSSSLCPHSVLELDWDRGGGRRDLEELWPEEHREGGREE